MVSPNFSVSSYKWSTPSQWVQEADQRYLAKKQGSSSPQSKNSESGDLAVLFGSMRHALQTLPMQPRNNESGSVGWWWG